MTVQRAQEPLSERDELAVLVELYADQPEDVADRILAAGYRRAPSADTRRLAYLEAALRKVAKKEGRYSRDPLDFACNTVEAMADVATSALAGTWENEEADAAMTQEAK